MGEQPRPGVGDIGLLIRATGVGIATQLKIDGLDPGWYRLRQVANNGTSAQGVFEVVAGGAPTVPLGPLDADRLSLDPVVLPPYGGTISVSRIPVPEQPADSPGYSLGDGVGLEIWTDSSWEPAGRLALTYSDDDPLGERPTVRVSDLAPGAYRLVDRNQPGEAQAVFWIADHTGTTRPER